jgi:hypothetical protein
MTDGSDANLNPLVAEDDVTANSSPTAQPSPAKPKRPKAKKLVRLEKTVVKKFTPYAHGSGW